MVAKPTFLRTTGAWSPKYGWRCNNSDSNNHKEEFSPIILDKSKGCLALWKKTAIMFRSITSHINSNIISLHDLNLDRAVEIGIPFIQTFKANWPEGFLDPITKQIITFASVGKPLKPVLKRCMTLQNFMGGFLGCNQVPEVSKLMIYWYTNWLY